MTYVTRVKTPSLIEIGDNDARIPYPQGQQLYRALLMLGVPTEFVHYPREGHTVREPRHKAFRDDGPAGVVRPLGALRRSPRALARDGAAGALRRLARIRLEYGGDAAARKLALLRAIDRADLGAARRVVALHETLCFLRAYPDDARVLRAVERMLARFDRRRDLARHRDDAREQRIAGTAIRFRFFHAMARWLTARWPAHLAVEWKAFEQADLLERLLPVLVHFAETRRSTRSTCRCASGCGA